MNDTAKTYGIFGIGSNRKLIEQLESDGNRVVQFPEVHKKSVELKDQDASVFSGLKEFDWVCFEDVFAVEFFIERLHEFGIEPFELDEVRIAVYGDAVSDRLRFNQLHADVISDRNEDARVFELIKQYLFDEGEIDGLKMLFVTRENSKSNFAGLFDEAGADVTKLPIYESEVKESTAKIKALFAGGAIDEVFLSSPDEVYDLLTIFQVNPLATTEISTSDQIAFQTLREFGFSPKLFNKKRG